MSIGNAMNSLPIAYAPFNGTGRKVAYALVAMSGEATVTPLPVFTVDPTVSLNAVVESQSSALRIAPVSGSMAALGGSTMAGMLIASGLMDAGGSADTGFTAVKAKYTAFASLSGAVTVLVAGPYRLRVGECDFTALYTAPGVRASGHALNSFALNMAALNAKGGEHRQTFEARCVPTGNIIAGPAADIAESVYATKITGNVIFDDIAQVSSSLGVVSPTGNALFSLRSASILESEALAFGVSMISSGASTQVTASAESLGSFVAGGKYSNNRIYGPAINAYALNSNPLNVFASPQLQTIVSSMSAIGNYIAGPSPSLDTVSTTNMVGNVLFGGLSDLGGVATCSPPANAIFAALSIVNAAAEALPSGNVLRDGICPTEQSSAQIVVQGNYAAGGLMLLSVISGESMNPSAVFDSHSQMDTVSIADLAGNVLFGGTVSGSILVQVVMEALRCRIAQASTGIEAGMSGSAWDKLFGIVSTVYGDAWSVSKGLIVHEDVVNYSMPESIIYMVEPVSVVYGQDDLS